VGRGSGEDVVGCVVGERTFEGTADVRSDSVVVGQDRDSRVRGGDGEGEVSLEGVNEVFEGETFVEEAGFCLAAGVEAVEEVADGAGVDVEVEVEEGDGAVGG
jgi:hypothetical protein